MLNLTNLFSSSSSSINQELTLSSTLNSSNSYSTNWGLQSVIDEMKRRNNLGYGLGIWLRKLFQTQTIQNEKMESDQIEFAHQMVKKVNRNATHEMN